MRNNRLHLKRDHWLLVLLALVGLVLTGCLEPESTGVKPSRAQPNSLTGNRPGYVYPQKAPLVNRSSLIRLLKQFGMNKTILWVMGDIKNGNATEMASKLSAERDTLQSVGIRIIGLYAGPSRDWQSKVRPMLRQVQANFTCAIIEPPAVASMANWLTHNPDELEPSLYILNEYQQVIARRPATPDQTRSLVADLTTSGAISTTTQPASRPIVRARIRLIKLRNGKTLATAASDSADLDFLAKDLAQQLSAQYKPTGTVAVLSIRKLGQPQIQNQAQEPSTSKLLSSYLSKHKWPAVIGPEKAAKLLKDLDLSIMGVEYDPARAASQISWEAIIVGTMTTGNAE